MRFPGIFLAFFVLAAAEICAAAPQAPGCPAAAGASIGPAVATTHTETAAY